MFRITNFSKLHEVKNVSFSIDPIKEVKKIEGNEVDKYITEHSPENAIIANPYQEYIKYLGRIQKEGENASFPEFKQTIIFLQKELSSPKVQILITNNPALKIQWDLAQTYLFQVGLDFIVDAEDYPYPAPFKPYPYRPTIEAVQKSLEFFDLVERLIKKDNVPLYHTDRYYYHLWPLLADKSVILFPTIRPLSMEDLVRVRSVPIGFLGVTTKTIFADRHRQSPLDFYVHDINHTRRMVAYLHKYCRENKATTVEEQLKVYQVFDHFIKETIIPNIQEKLISSQEDYAIRCIVRTIIFEIFHETAFVPTKESILNGLKHIPGAPAPFEHMILEDDFQPEELEKIRTKTGNLESGSMRALNKNKLSGVKVRYFMDEGPNTLANVYNKLVHGFYDPFNRPSAKVVPPKDRSIENIVKAAEEIFVFLGEQPLPKEKLFEYASSRNGIVRKFNYPKLRFFSVSEENRSKVLADIEYKRIKSYLSPPVKELITKKALLADDLTNAYDFPNGAIATAFRMILAENNNFFKYGLFILACVLFARNPVPKLSEKALYKSSFLFLSLLNENSHYDLFQHFIKQIYNKADSIFDDSYIKNPLDSISWGGKLIEKAFAMQKNSEVDAIAKKLNWPIGTVVEFFQTFDLKINQENFENLKKCCLWLSDEIMNNEAKAQQKSASEILMTHIQGSGHPKELVECINKNKKNINFNYKNNEGNTFITAMLKHPLYNNDHLLTVLPHLLTQENINEIDKDGSSPLDIAAKKRRDILICKLLLERGASACSSIKEVKEAILVHSFDDLPTGSCNEYILWRQSRNSMLEKALNSIIAMLDIIENLQNKNKRTFC